MLSKLHTETLIRQTILLVIFFLADSSRTLNVDSTAMTLPMSDPTAWATAMNNLGMAPLGIAGQPILPGMLFLITSQVFLFIDHVVINITV